ncbi:hypothetical protein NEHOM01_0598 [Nematocida homosporus]|uniref:uncharacterized protein n=1 Tax=Nematocida homosporus TaxID=1912981 RepID=UPI00221E8BD2|nr:uncharacterized protein NEHOM01_0598 [Nematocida homosporus]KAI5185093.1 hypothetical protein NEHOM01_0598 [Nematocida homosporus]
MMERERVGEKGDIGRLILRGHEVEPFTQRPFAELVQEAVAKRVAHVVGRVETKEGGRMAVYDARHLCKFMFELVISKEGRKVRVKNSTNPLDDRQIKGVTFYRVGEDMVGESIGTQKEFLESSKFRSKIFNRNDPFDALSINFVFKDGVSSKIKKKTVIPVLVSVLVLLLILMACSVNVLRSSRLKGHLGE